MKQAWYCWVLKSNHCVAEEPSFNEDPEKFVQRIRQEMQEEFKTLRVESAQAAARGKYADYNEKEAV